jgi:hypothetical protein
VLYAIVQVLRSLTGYRTDEVAEPSELDIRRDGALLGLSPKPSPIVVRLEIEFDDTEKQAIPQIFEETRELHPQRPLPAIPNGRVTLEWRYPPGHDPQGNPYKPWRLSTIDPWQARDWFKGRRYAIRGWRSRKLRKSLLLDVGGIYLFPQDRNLHLRVLGNQAVRSRIPESEALREEPIETDEDDQPQRKGGDAAIWGVLDWLGSYSQNREEPLADEDNWEKRIKDQFSRICAPKEYLGFMYQRDDPFGAPYFKDGNSVYPLSVAASGEQVIIEYITRLTYPTPMNHSLILIDEPEVHLHPGWIRQLYRALPEIGKSNQYILTTHSQELRTMAAEDGCLVDLGSISS